MNNQIIRKQPTNLIIRREKQTVLVKTVQKTITKIEDAVELPVIPEIPEIHRVNTDDLLSECSTVLQTNINDHDLTPDEIVEKIEYQREQAIKNKDKYKASDYLMKINTIDGLLSKVKRNLIHKNLEDMNIKRVKIDKIVLDKKIPTQQFKAKVDLTGERDNNDPTMVVLSSGREFFKKQGTYAKLPPNLAKIDPSKNKNINFGNQKMPPNLLKMINFC